MIITANVECENKSDTSKNREKGNISKSFRQKLNKVPGNSTLITTDSNHSGH
jgi:hypothetical protein